MTLPLPFPAPPVDSGSPIHASISPTALARIACALEIWQGEGAQLVSLPWVAPEEFVKATRPQGLFGKDVATPHGYLLASGEQAFCWLARQGLLEQEGPFVGWTPCFRNEPSFDGTHHYGFAKAEAFAWTELSPLPLQIRVLANRALAAMRLLAGPGIPVSLAPQDDGSIDVEMAGIEIGSVGARKLPGKGPPRTYLYATVLSEPRFSQALEIAQPRGGGV